MYDCSRCHASMRPQKGCESDATFTYFAGTDYETRRCPRRHLLDSPDVGAALTLWRACEGKPGVGALRDLSTHAVDAFAVIDAGRAAKIESDMREARERRGGP